MATKLTNVSRVPYKSSGIYFREIDLTVVSRRTGGFSAAAIGLMEKGPAFEIMSSSSYEDRAFRGGDLNPKFPSSYFAKQYLEQADNYKEVRVLGLEGYKDTVAYAITLSGTGSTAADISDPNDPTPLVVGPNGLVALLKRRPTTVTGGAAAVTSVEVQQATYIDPLTSAEVTRASDYLFNLVISYEQPQVGSIDPDTISVSLRPESDDYIVKKFGYDPLDTPLMKTKIAPLWVDFVIPSVKSKPNNDLSSAYYLPGSTTALTYLDITEGETVFGTTFTFQNDDIADVVGSATKTTVTVTGDITSWLADDDTVEITGVVGTGNIAAANGIWKVDNIAFAGGDTTFDLLDVTTSDPLTIIIPSSTLSGSATAKVAKYIIPTWETEMLDFEDIGYQTPLTPWIVSDGDANGDYKRLFRFFSISDGKSANTEIKVEIKDIDPSGNNGKGSFSIVVRRWSDRDDLNPIRLESFINVNMDPSSDNYIQRRIGDGEEFPLRSRFVFIEMNTDEEISANVLPYGCLGYPNVTGGIIQDVPWTVEYDLNKPVAKQNLGLANNKINMNKAVAPDMLAFKNSTDVFGKGFHLNPNNNSNLTTAQASVFTFAKSTAFLNNLGGSIVPSEKVKRAKFVVNFFGGFDGWNVYSQRTWNNTTSKDYEALQLAIAQFEDKEMLDSDFTVLVTPDLNFQDHSSACEAVLEMVVNRGDCMYIPDLKYDSTADVIAAVDAVISSNIRSNSAAVYFPHVQIEDPVNNKNPWLPPSLIALGTITYVSTNENVWQPPAGSIRTITNNMIRTRRRLKLDDREELIKANINPITSFPGSGYEIAGVRTTQEEFSALSFIHNRLLLCYAKKILNQTLRPLLYQLNGDLTQDAFLSTVRPIFDRIKKLNGVDEYSVEVVDKPELQDRTTLYGRITIVPLYPVERIVIDFVLADGQITYDN